MQIGEVNLQVLETGMFEKRWKTIGLQCNFLSYDAKVMECRVHDTASRKS